MLGRATPVNGMAAGWVAGMQQEEHVWRGFTTKQRLLDFKWILEFICCRVADPED